MVTVREVTRTFILSVMLDVNGTQVPLHGRLNVLVDANSYNFTSRTLTKHRLASDYNEALLALSKEATELANSILEARYPDGQLSLDFPSDDENLELSADA